MNLVIGYISDNNRTDYENIPTVHDFKAINVEQVADYPLIIIDVKGVEAAVVMSNRCRHVKENIPMIWLLDYEDYKQVHDSLSQVLGTGRILTVSRGEHLKRLDETIESILNPHLPVKREELAFVIPIYNEAIRFHHVSNFVEKIKKLHDETLQNMDIYFVDDGSDDESKVLIEKLIETYVEHMDVVSVHEPFSLHHLKINTRKAGTYIDAFDQISADTIIFADADDGYEFEDVMRLYNILKQGYYDLVVGTKDLTSENRKPVRRFVSACKRLMTKPLLPKGVTDSQTGLKVFNKNMMHLLMPSLDTSYGLAIDLLILNAAKKHNLRVYEMPVRFIDRENSHVNVITDSAKFMMSILKIMTKKGR